MKKSGMFVYLLASERSERDTYRGKNEKSGMDVFVIIFIYMLDVRMSFCTLTLRILCCSFDPVPNFTKQNPLV